MTWSSRAGVVAIVALSGACAGPNASAESSEAVCESTVDGGCASSGGSASSSGPASSSGSASSGGTASSSTAPTSTSGVATGPELCEGESGWTGYGNSSDSSPVGMDDDMPLAVTIQEIQQGLLDDGDWVLVSGVVVTSPRVPSVGSRDELFVQDPAGGPWSGLRVQLLEDVPAEPTVGEAVDVIGRVIELQGFYALLVGSPSTELVPVGAGVLPPPVIVPFDWLELDDEDGRAHDGVPIRVEQVMVTDDDPCDGEFVIEDIARVDDRFAPAQLAVPPVGSMLAAVEGVLVFAQDSFEIAPRGPEEVMESARLGALTAVPRSGS